MAENKLLFDRQSLAAFLNDAFPVAARPALMALIDVAAYAVVLAHIGPVAMAVTHTINVSFLRAGRWTTVVADARLLKLGKRLATVDVRLWQDSEEQLIAQSTVGYSLL